MEITEKTLQNNEAISKLKALVHEVNICMFTTLDEEGNIMSRPMSTIDVDEEGNVWFFTNEFSEKIQDVSKDNLVNLVYAHPAKNVYVNVKGTCSLVIDKAKMEMLWKPSLKAWFPEGLEDPKICLVKVITQEAYYWNNESSKVSLLIHALKSVAKGDKYKETEKGKLELQ